MKGYEGVKCYQLPVTLTGLSAHEIYSEMFYDKKTTDNQLQFVLLKGIGDCQISKQLTEEDILFGLNKIIEYRRQYMILSLFFILILITLDQVVKYLTVIKLKGQNPLSIIEGVFEFTYVENRGAAFGMLQNQRILFLIFTGIFILAALYILYKMPKTKRYRLLRLTMILYIAGGVGNFIDRARQGFVIDTFYFKLIDFAVFNVADSLVVIASFLFVYLLLFYYKDEDFSFISLGKLRNKTESSDDN